VTILETAWGQYRAWAARARQQQGEARSWAMVALLLACVSAACGALASQAWAGTLAAWVGLDPSAGKMAFAFLASAAAAAAPIVGRDILAVGRESAWIRARATAETIKSECFRYAAGLDEYAARNVEAARAFDTRIAALVKAAEAAGLAHLAVPETTNDPRRPAPDMTAEWYLLNRLMEQRNYFAKGQISNEATVTKLRLASLGLALAAAVLGVSATWLGQEAVAPWIGVMTTLATSVAAFGLMERRQFLAASYGAMVGQLDRLKGLFGEGALDLRTLVAGCEDLLAAENRAWADRVAQMPFRPPGITESPVATARPAGAIPSTAGDGPGEPAPNRPST
jgi:hypothetical protein